LPRHDELDADPDDDERKEDRRGRCDDGARLK
jgi:hypothetical protein